MLVIRLKTMQHPNIDENKKLKSGFASRPKTLAWICVGVLYFLMCWGNFVSSAGAGLACPDWPLCHGTITPPFRWDIVLEWGHRTLAALTSIFILATLWFSRGFRKSVSPMSARLGRIVLSLLASQIVLGGITVMLELSVAISTVHLLIATVIFSFMIWLAMKLQWNDEIVVQSASPKASKVRRLALFGLLGLFVQLALGALVRHGHAGLACPGFPSCSGESFFPAGYSEAILAFSHRWWGVLLMGMFIHLMIATKKYSPRLNGLALSIGIVAILQVALGIWTVLGGLPTVIRASHAAVGYALWAFLFMLYVRAGGLSFMEGKNTWKHAHRNYSGPRSEHDIQPVSS